MVKRIEGNVTDLETLQRLGRARDFIDHCYDHPLSLEQISEKACFSRYHFLRLFRQAFNKTPHQYLIERRIEKAKELLGGEELRVRGCAVCSSASPCLVAASNRARPGTGGREHA